MQDAFDEARRGGPTFVGDPEPEWYEHPGYVEYEWNYYDTAAVWRDYWDGDQTVLTLGLFLYCRP